MVDHLADSRLVLNEKRKGREMAAYLISYSAARQQASEDLDDVMEALGAVHLGDCLCGLEMQLDLSGFREWLTNQLDEGDSMVVIELRPRLAQANQNLSKDGVKWLERVLETEPA